MAQAPVGTVAGVGYSPAPVVTLPQSGGTVPDTVAKQAAAVAAQPPLDATQRIAAAAAPVANPSGIQSEAKPAPVAMREVTVESIKSPEALAIFRMFVQYREEVARANATTQKAINEVKNRMPGSGLSEELTQCAHAMYLQASLLDQTVLQQIVRRPPEEVIYREVKRPPQLDLLNKYTAELEGLKRDIQNRISTYNTTKTPDGSKLWKDIEGFQRTFKDLDTSVGTLREALKNYHGELKKDIVIQNKPPVPKEYWARMTEEQDTTAEAYMKQYSKPYDTTFSARCDLYAEIANVWNSLVDRLVEVSYYGECLAYGKETGRPYVPGTINKIFPYKGGVNFKSQFEGKSVYLETKAV